ncbi:lysylphosphatidylglycerol synthase transmembrane domain-containing protein [Kitasatospora cathayae]|uniref:Lysylphosphatidylglycerol synthase transmembrane domain-containing protein n=1 Tax=Kitasatospora cathayae TaxID=3004092 RepID=A0ABY7Q680_9ACTN|nr:lysylphosphatidylglycerol synthase transmembrane domain-containing protein [Kitasatospora sp. HUAS 3-15]WBP88106.1 lysylphosphatidylglycerol synthase transmembrane domain-containing protein [Kitasatospora sp. HUAS 3-15]
MAIVTGRTDGDTGGGGSTAPAGRPDTSGGIPGQPGNGAGAGTDAGAAGRPGAERRRARPLSDAGRIRQPVALIRLLTGLLAMALTLLLADYARATTVGIASDVAEAAALVPQTLAGLAGGLTTAAVLLLPVGLAVRRLLGPDRRRALQQVSDGLLAAVTAYGATLALDLWADDLAPPSLLTALTQPLPGNLLGHTEPVYGYLAPVLAFMTASGSRERRLPWAVLALSGLAGLAGGYATPTALLLGLLIGWTGAHGTLYAVGTPDPRPRPGEVLRALRDSGLRPVEALPAGPDHYRIRQAEERPELDVQLLDRQAVTAAAVQRAWRRLRLRTAPHPRALRSPRTGLEHEALVTYAALAAGVRTRRIAATAGLGHDTALIAYEHLAGRTLDQLDDSEITDELLTDAWSQLALLQRREIAHRALVPSSLLVDDTGAVHLVDFADGDIAASELVLRCDIAQLLTTLALRAGAARSVRAATTVLGPDALGAALPLLQPIALARTTRQSLKRHPDGKEAAAADPQALEGGPAEAAGGARPTGRHAAPPLLTREVGTAVPAGEARPGHGDSGEPATIGMATDGAGAAVAGPTTGGDGGSGSAAAPTGSYAAAPTGPVRPVGADRRGAGEPSAEQQDSGGGEPGPTGGLLEEIRAEVLRGRPEVVGRPVRLERLRPRTLLAVVGGVVAGWLLIPQFFAAEDNPIAALADADPWWLALAVVAAGLSHVAAGMGFVGFVPERLDFRNVVLAQLAGAFVKLVSPGGVGGIALNTRLLQQANIPTAQALSSVGVGQLIGLVLHLLQLGAFVYLVDAQPGGSELEALPAVVVGLVVAAVLLAVVWSIPPARRWLGARLRPLTAQVLPRLLDLLRNPGRLAVGVSGQLLVSLCLISCLYCCALAIGREPSFASVAVVFLVGNAAGNAAPTPGGAGAVDMALVIGLQQTASMEEGGALAAVALFRLLTLILPVLPGWAAMTWLQRRKAL